jgi:sialate O-acetylesterase
MPAIFGDHMVLQQEKKIPVWGWADAGEAVTVTLGDHTAKATADANGKWRADLDPVKTTSAPMSLTVAGKNSLTFDDVLVGDVWICSGQSNMEFDLGGDMLGHHSFGGAANAATAVPAANDPQLRLFLVKKKIALQPEQDVVGKWEVCTPESASLFSAVGYFFGQELRRSLHRPIGLIGTYWGGQPAQAFTSLSGLQKEPSFTNYVNYIEGYVANYPKAMADYQVTLAKYQSDLKAWNEANGPAMKEWADEVAKAKASGQAPPPKPAIAATQPRAPGSPEGGPSTPTVLYNGMIAPLIPYAIKGAIWYQGEANAGAALEYRTLFPRMISDWREKWGQGDFPFLFVQLAAFMKPQVEPSEGGWAYLREAQLMTLALPNTGMASAIDIGNADDIHPKDKLDVGLRLALAAKHVAYGQDVVSSGPLFDSMKIEGNKIRLTFKDVGSGLTVGTPPWPPAGAVSAPTALTGFVIAGADQKFVWGTATIDGNDIVVSSNDVDAPVAVRYGWANNPPCNLYNKEGLPASPFRTDDWPEAKPATKPAASAPTPKN